MSEISEEEPVVSFQIHAAEGDIMAKQGDFKKAIECYTKVCFIYDLTNLFHRHQ
jgi:hypothetical protein